MTKTLTLLQITKRFGGLTALDGVSLKVAPGERVALLGHNGAGKSTLMKIVLGLIAPDAGRLDIAGSLPGSPGARQVTAYLPENVAFHPALTGREMVGHYLRLRGQPAAGAGALLERVGLAGAADRRIGTYSKGMRQRVGLAQALIGQPRLLVLDEPTSGLDPVSRREFYAILDELAGQGAAILLSSHALTEVEARTDRILILSRGRPVAQGALAQLRAQADLPVTLVLTAHPGGGAALAAALPGAVPHSGSGSDPRRDTLILSVPQGQKLAVLARITALPELADLEVLPPSLEDIYAHHSTREVAA